MNTEHGLLSVALLTVTLVFVLAFNFLFVLVESSECLDSEQNHGDSNVYIPANCRPTECAVTGAYNHSTKYLQCSIKNYANHFPNACDKIKEEISSQSLEPGEHHAFQEACQATLASISLFMFHCQPLTPEVSLNFTFHFPLCGEDNTPSASAVMVEFSAGKESIDNYFARNHICRVFDFSGSSFSQLTHDDQIQLSYDCIAIGLRDSVSVHLEYYYYLSFSTFSAGDILNYTLVYQDVSSSSMQLVAAAWRSTSRVHVVFQPISGVNKYAVAAGCLQRNIFAQVISSPTVEISDIPPECSVVSVSVKPHAPECQKKGLTCSSIKVTLLDKTGLQLPEESRQTQEYGWLWSGRMIVSVVIVSLIIVSILVAVVLYRHKKKHAGDGIETAELPQLRVLCIASPSAPSQNLHTVLKKREFKITDAVQENIMSVIAMRDCEAILISLHPSLPDSNQFTAVMELLKLIFTNQQLWKKVRVASFCQGRQTHLKPSELLHGRLNNLMENKFLQLLDRKTFNLPEDKENLIKSLSCAESSCKNGQIKGSGHDLGHVEVLHRNGHLNGNIPRNGSNPHAGICSPVHFPEELGSLISGAEGEDVSFVHEPSCQVVFQTENCASADPRHFGNYQRVSYHPVQRAGPLVEAYEDHPQGEFYHPVQRTGPPVESYEDQPQFYHPVQRTGPPVEAYGNQPQREFHHPVQRTGPPVEAYEDHPQRAFYQPVKEAEGPRHARTCQRVLCQPVQRDDWPVEADEDHPLYPCDDNGGESSDDSHEDGPWKLACEGPVTLHPQ
ncbi:hypothetical protein V1264_019972 [Littorina saxatilis]|uniref:Uncharacterized protein n=1 Tax=Littorina saxatilis TaxID=31220 RepID=A0AAN9BDT6_9CAEN